MSLCDRNCVILRTNRARCALYRKILDLFNEAFLKHAVVELVYKFDENFYCEYLKGESIAKYDKKIVSA